MPNKPELPVVQYLILAFIGAGAFGLVQYMLLLLRESVDAYDWNGGLSALIAHPMVFAIVSAIVARQKIGHPVLNSVALLLVPFAAGLPLSGVFPIGPMALPALLLSLGTSVLVFTISRHQPSSSSL